ncbi:MAG: DUF4118 domain-containing protein, partial [Acidimicrobiales bacterium]
MARGQLRVYLGAAAGVGKTFAMLNEGRRRAERGTDVVVAYVETHGRANTAAQIGQLEVISRRAVSGGAACVEEMDVDAVLARNPAVALVDDLAHSNAPGSNHSKRWEDVNRLLGAGIDVISTVNIEHLESLNDVVEGITGVKQRETIPDEVVRGADQVELVDMAPEALRRRMAHGNIYPPDKVDAALGNYFRIGNLGALRELALMWVADQVDESLLAYKATHGIDGTWETRERVVVAVTGAPSGEHLIRRAARIAGRVRGELVGVHVQATDADAPQRTELLIRHQHLVEDLGGTYHEVLGNDIATALADFVRVEQATQLVLGASGRSRWSKLLRGSVINDILRRSTSFDVHVVSVEGANDQRVEDVPRRRLPPVSKRRQWIGWAIVGVGLPLLTIALAHTRGHLGLTSDLLLYLVLVVLAAAVGGVGPAVAAAVGGSLAANWYFTPPYHRFTVAEGENALALAVFLAVGALVSYLVLQSAGRAAEVVSHQVEVEALRKDQARERAAVVAAAADAEVRARADELRVAVLRAVSHDLRTPLASIKASVTSLLQQDVDWSDEAIRE